MNAARLLAVLALLPLLGACASSIEDAGIGKLKVDCQVFTKVQANVPVTCIEYTSGREIGEAKGTLTVLGADGRPVQVLTFAIKGVKAFEGQAAAAAAVESMTDSVSGAIARVLPDIVARVIKGPLP